MSIQIVGHQINVHEHSNCVIKLVFMNTMNSVPYSAGVCRNQFQTKLPPLHLGVKTILKIQNMCRRIQRRHLLCGHKHDFWVIECGRYKAMNENWVQKQAGGFWSQLLTSKPSCKPFVQKETMYEWCPFCTRARNESYPCDEFGLKLDATGSESKIADKSKIREELLSRGPSEQELTIPDMSANLRNSFLELRESRNKNKPGQWLPEIRSKIVNPGIDWEQWSHARDHILPPSPGPPPDKPLPPTPVRRQPTNVQKPLASASQGRQRDKTSQRFPRKHVAGQLGESYPRYNSRQVDGPAETVSPLPRLLTRREDWPLILDLERPLHDVLPHIPDPPFPLTSSIFENVWSSGQNPQTPPAPVRRGGSGTNRSREKPNKFQSSSVSPLPPDTNTPIGRYLDGPNRRAQTTSGRHENIRSMHGDRVYISPGLEQKIDDVEDYWMEAGAGPSKDNFQIPNRAETEACSTQGKRKIEVGKKR
jgi:hypothetical protein